VGRQRATSGQIVGVMGNGDDAAIDRHPCGIPLPFVMQAAII